MKKNVYIVPRTAKINAGIENFIMGSLVNNGDGTWSQNLGNGEGDDGTEDETRSKGHGFWDF